MATPRTFDGERLEARERPWATIGIVLAVLAALAYGVWLWRAPRAAGVLAWLAYAVALGFCLFMAWLRLGGVRRGRATLVLDADGIDYARFRPIPWTAVHAVRLAQSGGGRRGLHLLALQVDTPAQFLGDQGWQALQRRQWRGAARGELFIPLDPLDVAPERIHAAAHALRRRHGRTPDADWWPASLPSRESPP